VLSVTTTATRRNADDPKRSKFAQCRWNHTPVNAVFHELLGCNYQLTVGVAAMLTEFNFNPTQGQVCGSREHSKCRACEQLDGT
jgi:hypothetical protein